tara:strand:+ start:604 stop:1089 length:486 start_codon:yes stop_codon:yes gene_type:complete
VRSTFPRTRSSSSSSSSSSSQKCHARFSFRPLKKHGTFKTKNKRHFSRARKRERSFTPFRIENSQNVRSTTLQESRGTSRRDRGRGGRGNCRRVSAFRSFFPRALFVVVFSSHIFAAPEDVCFFFVDDENIENDQARDRFSSPKTGETSEEMHSPSDSGNV